MKMFVTLINVVPVVVAAYVFSGDVARGRALALQESFSRWTPESIIAHPEAFLAFAESETRETLAGLRAQAIRIAQNRAALESMENDAERRVVVGTKALDELKASFIQAEQDSEWPITWRNRRLNREGARKQIVALHRDIQSQQGLAEHVGVGLSRCDADSMRVDDLIARCEPTLDDINLARQKLHVEELSIDLNVTLTDLRIAISILLDESQGLATTRDLVNEQAVQVNKDKFAAIMAE